MEEMELKGEALFGAVSEQKELQEFKKERKRSKELPSGSSSKSSQTERPVFSNKRFRQLNWLPLIGEVCAKSIPFT